MFKGSGMQGLKPKLKTQHVRNLIGNIPLWEMHRSRHAGKAVRIWEGQHRGRSRILWLASIFLYLNMCFSSGSSEPDDALIQHQMSCAWCSSLTVLTLHEYLIS